MGFTKDKMNRPDIIENYRDNELLRNEYYNFISKIFPSADFKEWYSKGFWTDKFNPISIIKDGKLISNVSATLMNIIVEGRNVRGIQIGAVGTLPEFRNQGLSRLLMEYVIEKYNQILKSDISTASEEKLKLILGMKNKRIEYLKSEYEKVRYK